MMPLHFSAADNIQSEAKKIVDLVQGNMELLIIKSGEKYIRVKEGSYFICSLDKASVFPFAQMDKVKKHAQSLKKEAFKDIAIFRLVLTEYPIDNIEKCGF